MRPIAADYHTAVWTGSEMIVWGGSGISGVLNTGGRYNPSTDSWTATSTTNAPSAREVHTAVWTGSEMIVWGGYAAASLLNTGGRYNPSTNTWTATSSANAHLMAVGITCSLDRQRNDRLGRVKLSSSPSEHRREIQS